MTWRDGMGREMGAGFRMGNTCTPVPDACCCMAKPIQYCKVKNNKKLKKKDTPLELPKDMEPVNTGQQSNSFA